MTGTGHVWASPGVVFFAPGYIAGSSQPAPVLPTSGSGPKISLYSPLDASEPAKLSAACCVKPLSEISLGYSLCSGDIALAQASVSQCCPVPERIAALNTPVQAALENKNFIFRPPII